MKIESSALALVAVLAFALAAWGWGRMLLRGSPAAPGASVYTTVIGLGALAFAGGVTNLTRVAQGPVLWLLLGMGWYFAVRSLLHPGASKVGDKAALAATAVSAAVLGALLLPGAAFNPTDDLQLYFYRPVRMLQAGTLGGDPFDPIGFDSLGTHAFLQAFPVLALPLANMNAFDAVLCAALSVGLVFELGRALGCPLLARCGAAIALLLVHPQQVNVSPVYATVAFALALAMAMPAAHGASPRDAAPAGIVAAALVGAKTTNAPFAALFLLATLIASLLAKADRRGALRPLVVTAIWTGLFLAPWLLLHAGKYARALGESHAGDSIPLSGSPALLAHEAPLHWGASVFAYDAVALLALAGGIFAVWRSRRQSKSADALAPIAGVCVAASLAYVLGAIPFDIPHAVRYSAPFLVAGAAAAILSIGSAASRAATVACTAAVLCLAVLFGTSFRQRAEKLFAWRTTLAEPGDMRSFAGYTSWSLGEGTREWVRRAQAQVPAGEPMLALIACPHHLLYARNPVYVASEFGLTMPWLDLPLGADAGALRAFLGHNGVRYVIWQVGAGMKTDERLRQQLASDYPEERRLARFLLSFRESLALLTRSARVVYQADGLIVLDLRARGVI